MNDDTEKPLDEQAAELVGAVSTCLKSHRLDKGLSIYRLAQITGLNERTIDFIEKGERSPTIETATRIALALNFTLSEIIAEAEAQHAE